MKAVNNYFDDLSFKELKNYVTSTPFSIVKMGEKEFCVLPVPDPKFTPTIKDHKCVLSFIRKANNQIDTDWRIHADNIIEGQKVDYASVIYISVPNEKTGTAFYKHHIHGIKLTKNVSNQEFDRILIEDSNDLSKWRLLNVIDGKENKAVFYDANLFHSKWPNKIEKSERIVLVSFYKSIV